MQTGLRNVILEETMKNTRKENTTLQGEGDNSAISAIPFKAQYTVEIGDIAYDGRVSFYLATALIFFGLSEKKQRKLEEIQKAISYLQEFKDGSSDQSHPHPYWHKDKALTIAMPFQAMAYVVRNNDVLEGVQKALKCLENYKRLIEYDGKIKEGDTPNGNTEME